MLSLKTPIGQAVFLTVLSAIIGFTTNIFRPDGIPLLAKKLTAAEGIIVESEITQPVVAAISLAQAKALFEKNVLFIDAREEEYYLEGHIAGAWKNSFLMELAFNIEMKQGKDSPIVVYCSDDGCGSSEDLAYDLQSQGFNRIYVFIGGWLAWTNAEYPTESGG